MVLPRTEDIDDAYDEIWAAGIEPPKQNKNPDALRLTWWQKIACVYIFVALIPFLAIYGLLYLLVRGGDDY